MKMNVEELEMDYFSPKLHIGKKFINVNDETIEVVKILEVENKHGKTYVKYEYVNWGFDG